jgi:hypothetical protein
MFLQQHPNMVNINCVTLQVKLCSFFILHSWELLRLLVVASKGRGAQPWHEEICHISGVVGPILFHSGIPVMEIQHIQQTLPEHLWKKKTFLSLRHFCFKSCHTNKYVRAWEVCYNTVTKSDRFLEGHSKFPPQSQKTFVSDTGKNFTLSKAFFLRLLSGKLFHSGECAFFHL